MGRKAYVITLLAGLIGVGLFLPYPTAMLGQRLTVACPGEDGGPVIPCRWDARTMGNRQGTAVYLVTDTGDGIRPIQP